MTPPQPSQFDSDAIERAAKVLFSRMYEDLEVRSSSDWDKLTEEVRDMWREDVRALIAALEGEAA